jgi:hypothetical protein
MFNRKKIDRIRRTLFDHIERSDNRIAVLEFKLKAENKKYIVRPSYDSNHIFVEFLSVNESKVIIECFYNKWIEIKQNDKYLEFWSMSWSKRYLDKVMYINDDKLVNMDVDVYTKAFYPQDKSTDPIVKIGVETKKATEDIKTLTTNLSGVTLKNEN